MTYRAISVNEVASNLVRIFRGCQPDYNHSHGLSLREETPWPSIIAFQVQLGYQILPVAEMQ